MTLKKRSILITGAALLVLAVGYALLGNGGVEVSVEPVTRDTLSVSLGVEGRTRARELFTVASQFEPYLIELLNMGAPFGERLS